MHKPRPPSLRAVLVLASCAVPLLAAPTSAAASTPSAAVAPTGARDAVRGIDVSHHQGRIDWSQVRASGVQFAYIKATQGVTVEDSRFDRNYTAATRAGVVRGAYHFASPSVSSGRRQADFLVAHGGAWSADGRTLPAMLDLEANKRVSRDPCYGFTDAGMVRWVRDFVNRYHARTGRWPVIYTSRGWWSSCTGGSSAFRRQSPLMLAAWNAQPGRAPGRWSTYTIWQSSEAGHVPGIAGHVDLDAFNGSRDRLLALADNTR